MTPSDRGTPPLAILVVDDELNIRRSLSICLKTDGHCVVAVTNPHEAIEEARRRSFDLAFVDLRLGTESGMDLIPALLADSPWMKIIVITAYAAVDTAVEAIRRGAADYLPKPFTPAHVSLVARKVADVRALEQKVQGLQDALRQNRLETDFTSTSPAMQREVSMARQVAKSDATVLLTGESGTGKGVLARAIHTWSDRSGRPFTSVSCPSLSTELLESELFGHVRGAFTGAIRNNPGRIAATEGGTLLLDEIGDLPSALQPKLLRFLQDREYERVGDTATRKADVRVIAATNIDLEEAVRAGRFREDLFYRINVIRLDIPPLRQRPDDIILLAESLLASLRGRKTIVGYTEETAEALRRYTWPGNVRELRNVIERAVILCHGDYIEIEHLPPNFSIQNSSSVAGDLVPLEQIERQHICRVLAATRSLEDAARVLGMDSATLWRRRKKYGM